MVDEMIAVNIKDMVFSNPPKLGRELDLLIASKFYGIKKVYYGDWDTERGFPQCIPSSKPWRTHSIDARGVPMFSTDASDCYQLKLKIINSGYRWIIKSPEPPIENNWKVYLNPYEPEITPQSQYEAKGITEMEAICRCALLAYEDKPVTPVHKKK